MTLMTDLKSLPAQAVPARIGEVRIGADAFVEQWQTGACELVDIRIPAETRLWKMGFGLTIPADEIAERLDGEAKYLMGGLLGLVDKLKGATSERFKLEQKE